MAILDFIDKLDDIIYEPINAICEWVKEPLKTRERNHELNKIQKQADINESSKRLDFQIEEQRANLQMRQNRESEQLIIDMRKYNAEIDMMINDQEDARCDRLVESLKRYQMDLAMVSTNIAEEIGNMSLDLRERANNLMLEQTQKYRAMQDDAIDKSTKRLEDIQTRFANNERVRSKMEDSIINQMDMIVKNADRFINELSEDIKRLNQNIDNLTQKGFDNANDCIRPLAEKLVGKTSNGELLLDKH